MTYIGFTLIFIGLFFITSGVVGLFRFRDFYSKMHASSVVECCGVPLCLIGLAFLQSGFAGFIKLVLIALLILLLNPVSTHALARASIPYKLDQDGRIK